MLQVIGIAFATIICYVVLKDKTPQFALAISIAGVIIVLALTLVQIKNISSQLNEILSLVPTSATYVKLMVKALIIVILTQITADICRENGNSSLASVVEISAKIIIISMVIPLFKTILTLILGLVK